MTSLLLYAKATGNHEVVGLKQAGYLCRHTLLPLARCSAALQTKLVCEVALYGRQIVELQRGRWTAISLMKDAAPWWRFCMNSIRNPADIAGGIKPNVREEAELGKQAALSEFLTLAKTLTKSLNGQHLFISGHGGGWRGGAMDTMRRRRDLEFKALQIDVTASSDLTVTLSTEIQTEIASLTVKLDANSSLQPREMADAISGCLSNGDRLGMVGFHSCLMATIEVAYDLRNCATHLFASGDLVLANAIPYVPWLCDNSLMTATSAEEICKPLFTALELSEGPASFFLIDLSKVDIVKTAIDSFAIAIDACLPSRVTRLRALIRAVRNSPNIKVFGDEYSRTVDLGQFFTALSNVSDAFPDVKLAAQAVAVATTNAAHKDLKFVAKADEALTPEVAGITIFFPATKAEAHDTYGFDQGWYEPNQPSSAAKFIDDSRWRQFLDWLWDE